MASLTSVGDSGRVIERCGPGPSRQKKRRNSLNPRRSTRWLPFPARSTPPANPADPRRPDPPGRLPDDSMDQLRLAALTRAARALVGVDDARVRDLLDDLLRTLESGD